jgi:uncharacterized repeat protein (TIGR04076 family)
MVQSKWYKVAAKVSSQQGTCAANHKAGEEFIIGDSTPNGMCCWAFFSLFPFISVLQSGGSFPWEDSKDKSVVACPDPLNPVVWELRRIPS